MSKLICQVETLNPLYMVEDDYVYHCSKDDIKDNAYRKKPKYQIKGNRIYEWGVLKYVVMGNLIYGAEDGEEPDMETSEPLMTIDGDYIIVGEYEYHPDYQIVDFEDSLFDPNRSPNVSSGVISRILRAYVLAIITSLITGIYAGNKTSSFGLGIMIFLLVYAVLLKFVKIYRKNIRK